MVASRLKLCLDKIIAPVEGAFVPSRLITDSILLAYECIHTIKIKGKAKRGIVL